VQPSEDSGQKVCLEFNQKRAPLISSKVVLEIIAYAQVTIHSKKRSYPKRRPNSGN
jgi:hypothetical protein